MEEGKGARSRRVYLGAVGVVESGGVVKGL